MLSLVHKAAGNRNRARNASTGSGSPDAQDRRRLHPSTFGQRAHLPPVMPL